MAADPEILQRLDRIQATLALAFASEIGEARERIRADNVNAAILDASGDWIGTTELQNEVAKKLDVTTRTVRDRFPGLVAQGVLEARGAEYRSTGLI